MSDFHQYQTLIAGMRSLLREGKHDSPEFQKLWNDGEKLKKKCGGYPPIPDDYEAAEMEACETANMEGTR